MVSSVAHQRCATIFKYLIIYIPSSFGTDSSPLTIILSTPTAYASPMHSCTQHTRCNSTICCFISSYHPLNFLSIIVVGHNNTASQHSGRHTFLHTEDEYMQHHPIVSSYMCNIFCSIISEHMGSID